MEGVICREIIRMLLILTPKDAITQLNLPLTLKLQMIWYNELSCFSLSHVIVPLISTEALFVKVILNIFTATCISQITRLLLPGHPES